MRLYTICHNGAKFCVQNNKKRKKPLQNKRQFATDKQNYQKTQRTRKMSHFTPPILPVKIFRQIKKFTFKITLQRKQTQKAECNFENSGVNTITVKQQFAFSFSIILQQGKQEYFFQIYIFNKNQLKGQIVTVKYLINKMTVNPTVCVVISHKFYNKTKPLFENAFCKTNQIKQQNVTFTHRREHNCRKTTNCL